MTSLRMVVTSVEMTTILNIPNTESSEPSGITVTIQAFPEDRDYLELKTGEVFCNPSYSKLRGEEKIISGTLYISRGRQDQDYPRNKLRYSPEVQTDDAFSKSFIYFNVCLPPSEFDDLITNIRNRLTLALVSVELKHDIFDMVSPIVYGWEPDGSHLIWHNDTAGAQRAGVDITSVKFGYRLFPAPDQIKAPKKIETITNRLLSEIRRDMRRFRMFFLAIVIVAAIAYFTKALMLR